MYSLSWTAPTSKFFPKRSLTLYHSSLYLCSIYIQVSLYKHKRYTFYFFRHFTDLFSLGNSIWKGFILSLEWFTWPIEKLKTFFSNWIFARYYYMFNIDIIYVNLLSKYQIYIFQIFPNFDICLCDLFIYFLFFSCFYLLKGFY